MAMYDNGAGLEAWDPYKNGVHARQAKADAAYATRKAARADRVARHNYNELQKANAAIRELEQRLAKVNRAAESWRERALRAEEAFHGADLDARAWRETTRWLHQHRAPELSKEQIKALFREQQEQQKTIKNR